MNINVILPYKKIGDKLVQAGKRDGNKTDDYILSVIEQIDFTNNKPKYLIMRIVELITTKNIKAKIKKPYDLDRMRDEYRSSSSAYGQGKAISKSGIQGAEYSKTNYFPSELQDDAYYAYIEAVKPLMGSNPYVPEIYKIIHITDSNGKVVPRYEMRTYKPYDKFNKRDLISILSKISKEEADKAESQEDYDTFDIWNIITGFVRNSTQNDRETDDTDLNEVLEIIRNVVASNPAFEYDMHRGNFMIRRTPYGPQLVITDPVQDGGHSIAASRGGRTWGSKRGTADVSRAVRLLGDNIDSIVDQAYGTEVNPEQFKSQIQSAIRKVGIDNRISPKDLIDNFKKFYSNTPIDYAMAQVKSKWP